MSDIVLNDRECRVLKCIVESYVQTATPVGSRYLGKKYKLGVSPATIRNVMNDLEECGYLRQPHVSAGRVPTDKGYRFYVDNLNTRWSLQKRDRDLIHDNFREIPEDVRDLLEASSRVLARISSQLGVVLEPRFYKGIFQKMELVPVSDNRLLAVISIKSGLVKTIMMELRSQVSRDKLHETCRVINERLFGLSLREVKDTVDRRLADVESSDDDLIKVIVSSRDRLFNFDELGGFHFDGTLNIASTPEFMDRGYANRMLQLLENKRPIVHLFDEPRDMKTAVTIGGENRGVLLHDCSVIMTRYWLGGIEGSLGVFGPTRMPYSRLFPLVDYMGDFLTRMLSDKMS